GCRLVAGPLRSSDVPGLCPLRIDRSGATAHEGISRERAAGIPLAYSGRLLYRARGIVPLWGVRRTGVHADLQRALEALGRPLIRVAAGATPQPGGRRPEAPSVAWRGKPPRCGGPLREARRGGRANGLAQEHGICHSLILI